MAKNIKKPTPQPKQPWVKRVAPVKKLYPLKMREEGSKL